MNKFPLVTVIIPTYNASNFVGKAIQSVLDQTYQHTEIIVVDDGSSDTTVAAIKVFGRKVQLIKQTHGGISKSRNTALAVAKGDLIAFLDADDVWLPTKLELQVRYLETHPQIGMVFCWAENFYDTSKGFHPPDATFEPMKAHIPPACVFRHKILDQVGVFDEEVMLGEFADWYGRVIDANIQIGMIDSLQVMRRIHGENIGIRHHGDQLEYVRILKRKIDRAKRVTV